MIICVLNTLCVRDACILLLQLFHLGYRLFSPMTVPKMLVYIANVID
jgi:uncharacterized membrane protein (DUF373 family)